jgi:hypothetical protein
MKLKEKFENFLHNWIDEDYNRQHVAEVLEIDADDFAIGFAMSISTHCYCELGNDTRSYQELLEIYKKEKGL